MRRRWVCRPPEPELPVIGQAIIASWWPWIYYWVSTVEIDQTEPLGRLWRSFETGVYSEDPVPEQFVTQVFRCNRSGWVKDMRTVYYQREYSTLEEAQSGHEEVLSGLTEGSLILQRQVLPDPCDPEFWKDGK